MKTLSKFILSVLCYFLLSCEKDEKIDSAGLLSKSLQQEIQALGLDPLQWSDEELHFLDAVSDYKILGLGEATHGSSEFFKAKHRMFKYLVEHHGFRIFAIEADFGESIFINEAVLKSDKSRIETLIREKMHFWTWQTTEVRDLLYWMCDYNVGKARDQKVEYWGIDCQFNTYHPAMVAERLQSLALPFNSFATPILDEANFASANLFSNYSQSSFDAYLTKVIALKDSVSKYKDEISAQSSTDNYEMILQLVNEIRYVSESIYSSKTFTTENIRDKYMAKNTGWLHDYLNGAKIVLWAHNYHVSNFETHGTMGSHLKVDYPEHYTSIGFLFSKGTFTAFTFAGGTTQALEMQTLETSPKALSINDIMSRSKAKVFHVRISDLQKHDEWIQNFSSGTQYFEIGAVYNKRPFDYYRTFDAKLFDGVIYFDRTNASSILN